MGFDATPETIQAAGVQAAELATELRGADCGSPVNELTAAIPGTEASGAGMSYATTWAAALASWCEDADEFGSSLSRAAMSYRTADDNARTEVVRHEPKLGGPL
ncbi:hypothetical protein [Amycolatopsis suaedae]|uniref:Uncharacterized protein n=1 Tax=Amycolatopsis suaedae TaxID=2510978 RepID=A0A4Q7J7V6_9PSEU|nr:hypothetical protein [Amycolatopsis suaedae]RZQ62144.1 hypothetical protein EWH70_21470 [Amycolatopsis suaedae]